MAWYHRHFFSRYKCSVSCKTQPQRASIGRCTEWLKKKRYTTVQMGPVAMEVRYGFFDILPATGQNLQTACSVLPPCSQELKPTSLLHCHIPLLCHSPNILRLPDGDIMSMEGEVWTEVQALLQDSSDTSCACCEDAAVKGIQMLLEGRNSSCSLADAYILFFFISPVPLT